VRRVRPIDEAEAFINALVDAAMSYRSVQRTERNRRWLLIKRGREDDCEFCVQNNLRQARSCGSSFGGLHSLGERACGCCC
jgi:hypothetical protein